MNTHKEEELTDEARYVAEAFDAMSEEARALLWSLVDYILRHQ